MARTNKRNPWKVKGNVRPAKVRAADSKTWQAGEFGVYSSGLAQPIATDAVDIKVQFLQDQAASTSSTDVWVDVLEYGDVFEGFVSTDDADTTATVANVGEDYGIHVGNNYHTVNTGETSNVAVTVLDYAGNYNPLNEAITDSPGKVTFRFKASVLDAS